MGQDESKKRKKRSTREHNYISTNSDKTNPPCDQSSSKCQKKFLTSLSFIVNLITFIKDNLKDKWGNIDSNKIYAFGEKNFYIFNFEQ